MFEKNLSLIEQIKEIIECPKLYLVYYFDEIKSKVDTEFLEKLRKITDINLENEINQTWIKLIDIIEKCQEKCLKNSIPNDLINEANGLISEFQLNESNNNMICSIQKMKRKLESHLLENSSYLAILIQVEEHSNNHVKKSVKAVIAEEEFSSKEIERWAFLCLITPIM